MQYTNLLNGVTGFVEVEKVNGFITIRVSAKTNKEVTAGWLNILKLPNEYRIAQDKVQYGVPDPSSTGYPHQHGASMHFYNTGDIHFGKWSANNVNYLATVTAPAANDL